MSWWSLVSVWTAVFTSPWAGATEPLLLPLPQTVDYATEMRGQLLAAHFSTDPQAPLAQVAAESTGAGLEAFIINYEACLVERDAVAYRLVVRNVSENVISGVVAQFQYPPAILEYKEAVAIPATAVGPGTTNGLVEWQIGTVLPGAENWHELNVTFVAAAGGGNVATELTVSGGASLVLTSHTLPNNCPSAPEISSTPAPVKQPAIVCDPGEIGCAGSLPSLGKLFEDVVNNPARVPTVCSPNDPDGCSPNQPSLGPRFAEAVASLLPGECSTLEDAVLADPQFHDGLNRRAEVADLFMRPLYNSGQDFLRLMLENELLGINNTLYARSVLSVIHTKYWQRRLGPLENVLRGALSTDTVRGQINRWHLDWIDETRQAQQDLQKQYATMEATREAKFDPVARAAIANAKTSLERACGALPLPPLEEDAGLERLLVTGPLSVKQKFAASQQERITEYQKTQALFVDLNNKIFPEAYRAATWQRELRDALDAFDQKNKQPLQAFAASIPQRDQDGFEAIWRQTYQAAAEADVAADELIRLNQWEIALDTPKKEAAECARDTSLAARVEISWCESGHYPSDYIIREAPDFAKSRDALPPELIDDGEKANIDVQRTVGVSCRGLPGDPFWAADCSCNCNQLVAGVREGNILFCQAGRELEEPPEQPDTRPPVTGGRPPSSGGGIKPIIRHDLYSIAQGARTQDECLQERPLDDHFLVDYP